MSHARTLAHAVCFRGVGLFSALPSALTIHPRHRGHGLAFRRTDLPEQPIVAAHVSHVFARPRQTVLTPQPGAHAPAIHTVEHILSALLALGVTDVLIELNGPEVPLMDGSAAPFVPVIRDAGVVAAPPAPAGVALRDMSPLVAVRPIAITLDGASIQALPPEGPWMDIEYYLDYGPGSPIPPQSARFRVRHDEPDADGFAREIAPARTFCTADEARSLHDAGLFSHLRATDVLVIGRDGPIDTAYRMPDEPARHKVLDVIGDLALTARAVHARIIATRSGHALNHALARALLEQS